MLPTDSTPLWHELTGDARASAVKSTCDELDRTEGARRRRMQRNIELYEGLALSGLSPSAYFDAREMSSEDWDYLRVNVARGLVHTAVAKIAGKQKPKTQVVVNDGDWTVKRKAKKMERFAEAHMMARQGNCSDAWEQGLEAERDCCVTDLGALAYEADLENRRIDIYRTLPWQLMAGPLDAQNGDPQTLFRVRPYDVFKLAVKFPKHKDAIMSAQDLTSEPGAADFYGSMRDASRFVLVREAWRLPVSKDKPGAHAIVAGGVDLTGGDEEWTAGFFPFEFFVWEKRIQGLYGASIVDNVYHLVHELNAAVQRMADQERHAGGLIIDVEDGTYQDEALLGNLAKSLVKRRAGKPPASITVPSAISASSVNWWQLLKGQCFEIPGVSQMSATGQKDPGVEAAVAMRTIENIATERFAPQWQAYERRMSVGSFRQIIARGREIATEVPDYAVKWNGNGFLQELKLKDFDLEDDKYQTQPYAVSGLVNTPADRLSLAGELLDRQIISPDAYARVIQAKDVDAEIGRTNTWTQLIEKYIESWLDATRETEASGKFRYRPPMRFMPLADIIVQVGRAFAFAEMEGTDDYNLQFFIRFMGDCDREIQKIKAQEAALQAAAKASAPIPMPMGVDPAMAGAPPPPEMPPPGGMLQ